MLWPQHGGGSHRAAAPTIPRPSRSPAAPPGGDDERARRSSRSRSSTSARIDELRGIRASPDGTLAHRRLHAPPRDRRLRRCCAAPQRSSGRPPAQIANATVRNMGTIGGSISFADPGLDYPPAIVAADAAIEIAASRSGGRVAAADFFVDWYTTALEPGEIVTAVMLPRRRPAARAYVKHARVSRRLRDRLGRRLPRPRRARSAPRSAAAARRRSATTPPMRC